MSALDEAIELIRDLWDTDERGGVFRNGTFYHASGAKRGPKPTHPVPIWVGGHKPRMLRMVGRLADGWLPSLGYLDSRDVLDSGHEIIDDAARTAGRNPRDVRRLLNVSAADAEPETLAELALRHRIDTFIVATDDREAIRHVGESTVPAVRARVAAGRDKQL